MTFWVGHITNKTQDIKSNQAVLLCDPDLMQTEMLLKKSKKKGIVFQRIINSSSQEVTRELKAKGCGIDILPRTIAMSSKTAKLNPLPDMPFYSDEICLVYRPENKNVKSIQTIILAIKKTLSV